MLHTGGWGTALLLPGQPTLTHITPQCPSVPGDSLPEGMDATGTKALLEEGGGMAFHAMTLSTLPSPIPRWGGEQGSLFAVFSHPGPSFLLFT